MPMRWVVSPIVGTGVKGDSYRAQTVGQPGVFTRSLFNMDTTVTPSVPKTSRCLALVWGTAASLQAAGAALPDVRVIPPRKLDDTMSQLQAGQRNALRTLAGEFGLDPAVYVGATTLRTVVEDIGRTIDPAFSIEAFEAAVPEEYA